MPHASPPPRFHLARSLKPTWPPWLPLLPLCTASPVSLLSSTTPLGDLRAEAQSVLRRLCRLVHTNKERLFGMVAQFDEGDKGYLNKMELVGRGALPTWSRGRGAAHLGCSAHVACGC